MIQIRNNVFETNSSSSHSLCVMKREMYNDWKNHKIALSIHYVWGSEEKHDNFGTDIKPTINLPENFNDLERAKKIAIERYNDEGKDLYFDNLQHGDNGFMRTNGNFDTYAPIVRQVEIEKQKEENIKILDNYLTSDSGYIDWLKETNKYDALVALINQYKETGEFNEDMYKSFPITLFYTPEQYETALKFDDCDSTFIHVFADVVAFGYYFHS